jgi:hypothetical protein
MLENLRINIAHLIIRILYFKSQSTVLRFNKVLTTSKDFLIIMPNSIHDFANSFDFVRYFLIHKKNVTLFVNDNSNINIPQKEYYKYISYSEKSKTYFFLPKTLLKKQIKEKSFDVVIDLNRKEDIFSSSIVCILDSKIKVGFLRSRSDKYYNLLIQDSEIHPESAYSILLKYLSCF